MKYFKLFLTVCAMAIAMSANAQSKTTAKSKTTTAKPATTAPAKKTTTAKPATTTAKPAATASSTTKTTKTTTSKPAAKKTYVSNEDRGFYFLSETKIGGYYPSVYYIGGAGFGENLVGEYTFNKYVAWDFISVDFSAPFDFDALSIGVKTGVRGWTPRFASDKLRGYGTLALGWDMGLLRNCPYVDIDPMGNMMITTKTLTDHGFGLSFGFGIEALNHYFLGYTLEYSTVWKSTSHFAKFGFRF